MSIIAIDFEASCLPRHGRSFPIEVGVSCYLWTRSWIIRPHDDWAEWDWTPEAEALHGLTRERIKREGRPVADVLEELTIAVGRSRVVADSLIDQYWLDTLANAAGMPRPFTIDHVSLVMDEAGAGQQVIADAVAKADGRHPTRHRASDDARWLSVVIEHILAPVPVPASSRWAGPAAIRAC